MDIICLLLVPDETEVNLQILQTNKVCSDSTRNEKVKMSVCPINFDGTSANGRCLVLERFFCFGKFLVDCG